MGHDADQPDAPLPAHWVRFSTEDSSVELRPDGTGTFVDLPLWTGARCDSDEVTPFSGELRWQAVDGHVEVGSPNGPMSFRPKATIGGDDGSTLAFGEAAAALSTHGGVLDWAQRRARELIAEYARAPPRPPTTQRSRSAWR